MLGKCLGIIDIDIWCLQHHNNGRYFMHQATSLQHGQRKVAGKSKCKHLARHWQPPYIMALIADKSHHILLASSTSSSSALMPDRMSIVQIFKPSQMSKLLGHHQHAKSLATTSPCNLQQPTIPHRSSLPIFNLLQPLVSHPSSLPTFNLLQPPVQLPPLPSWPMLRSRPSLRPTTLDMRLRASNHLKYEV